MAEQRSKMMHGGKLVDGFDVPFEANEKWTELTLEDGSTLRVKLNVIGILRPDNQYDPAGNPMYIVNATPTIAIVSVPERLKQKKQ